MANINDPLLSKLTNFSQLGNKGYAGDNSGTPTDKYFDIGEGVGGNYTGRFINIAGTNAAPDGTSGGFDGLTAKTNLQGKGFAVITN
ncbi:MAG: hypothetical protein MUP82_10375 [Candidatus Marinimicrobia bacterium]|nr:hypothetical protein [Candidatus Neomarinimicrobiota bacterium]